MPFVAFDGTQDFFRVQSGTSLTRITDPYHRDIIFSGSAPQAFSVFITGRHTALEQDGRTNVRFPIAYTAPPAVIAGFKVTGLAPYGSDRYAPVQHFNVGDMLTPFINYRYKSGDGKKWHDVFMIGVQRNNLTIECNYVGDYFLFIQGPVI